MIVLGPRRTCKSPGTAYGQACDATLTLSTCGRHGRKPRDNAAPEWQAESLGRHNRKLVVACPLEGTVRLLLLRFIQVI
jgi:hypothetical protein